jgi:hypothetical protein
MAWKLTKSLKKEDRDEAIDPIVLVNARAGRSNFPLSRLIRRLPHRIHVEERGRRQATGLIWPRRVARRRLLFMRGRFKEDMEAGQGLDTGARGGGGLGRGGVVGGGSRKAPRGGFRKSDTLLDFLFFM